MRPFRVVTILTRPRVARSVWARSFSANGQRRIWICLCVCAASASLRPTCASSGSVKVTQGRISRPDLVRRSGRGWSGRRAPPGSRPSGVNCGPPRDVADRVDAAVASSAAARSTLMPRASKAMRASARPRSSTCGPAAGGEKKMRAVDVARPRAPSSVTRTPFRPRRATRVDVARLRGCRSPPPAGLAAAADELGIVAWRSAVAASSTVTSEPRRRKACAISRPIGPPPMTMRWRGQARQVEDRLVREVGDGVEIGDRRDGGARAGRDHEAAGADPRFVRPPRSRRPMKRAAPRITLTPRPVKRSTESFGAMRGDRRRAHAP